MDEGGEGEEDAVSLLELMRSARDNWDLIKKVTGLFLALGVLVAVLSPVEFQAEAELMPEMQESQSGAGSLLEQYGGVLGLSGLQGAMSQEEEGMIPTEVYPRIVQSLTFQDELLRQEVAFSEPDTTLSIYRYFERHYRRSVPEWLLWNTVEVPGRIMRALGRPGLPDRVQRQLEEEELTTLSYSQWRAIQKLRDRVYVTLNPETGVLLVSAEMPDAAASAQVAERAVTMLTRYLKEYRTQKARQDLEFQTEQLEQARKRFRERQEELADFQDRNARVTSARLQAREDRLRAEYDLAYDLYTSAAQQQAEARRKLQEQTPVFKVIQESSVPMENSKPRRVLTILSFLAAGLAVSYLYIAGHRVYRELRAKL